MFNFEFCIRLLQIFQNTLAITDFDSRITSLLTSMNEYYLYYNFFHVLKSYDE